MPEQDIFAPDGKKWEARNFVQATMLFCQEIVKVLTPIIPEDLSLDLQVTIRRGKIRIQPTPLHFGPGWKDQSGG